MSTFLFALGCGLLIAGGALWSLPAALIIGGLVLVAVTVGLNRAGVIG